MSCLKRNAILEGIRGYACGPRGEADLLNRRTAEEPKRNKIGSAGQRVEIVLRPLRQPRKSASARIDLGFVFPVGE